MTVKGHDIPHPITTFDEAGFPDYVLQEVKDQGFLNQLLFSVKVGLWL